MSKRREILKGLGLVAAASVAATVARAQTDPSKEHRLVIQVSDNNPALMTLALNNAANVSAVYAAKGEDVTIEVVAYGPGLHMLRADTSPIKERVEDFPKSMPNFIFSACANTIQNMEKTEGKSFALIGKPNIVDAGVVRLMELQEQGWSYIKV